MAFKSEFDNVSVCSINLDFVVANRDPLLPKQIPKPSGDIKKLLRLARRTDLDLWFEDECHFQQHGSRYTMWVPPEDRDPVILHAPTRKSIAVFGAVCAENGRLVTHHSKIFAADTFLEFLQRVVRHKKRDQKMVLVLDNARYHHAKAIQPWLKKASKNGSSAKSGVKKGQFKPES